MRLFYRRQRWRVNYWMFMVFTELRLYTCVRARFIISIIHIFVPSRIRTSVSKWHFLWSRRSTNQATTAGKVKVLLVKEIGRSQTQFNAVWKKLAGLKCCKNDESKLQIRKNVPKVQNLKIILRHTNPPSETPNVVYFDQLWGTARSQKLVKILFLSSTSITAFQHLGRRVSRA